MAQQPLEPLKRCLKPLLKSESCSDAAGSVSNHEQRGKSVFGFLVSYSTLAPFVFALPLACVWSLLGS